MGKNKSEDIVVRPLVAIVMGSDSDLVVMEGATKILRDFKVDFELTIVSAHRTPHRLFEYATTAIQRGLKIIIAGAGGAAHLPGMIASITTLPVVGVPVKSSNSLDGWDSILSILQMPNGVPVATVALNASKNAAILAIQILALSDNNLARELEKFKTNMKEEVDEKIQKLIKHDWLNNFDQAK